MNPTKIAAICFAALGAITGVLAAHFWNESSKIAISPSWGRSEPPEIDDQNTGWIVGTLDAFSRSAALNQKAAKITAVSVMLSAVAGVLGSFS
ncbi:MAG TPA: hypothetical protein VFU55_00520 [Terracidiphilus sp.]|nr:hypothetical protein [Terracidiphilus sp.]